MTVDGEEVWRHLEHLCTKIGPRVLGTRGDHEAADYIASLFREFGLRVEIDKLSCPSWDHKETLIQTSESVFGPPHAHGCMFSPPCDIYAEVVAIGLSSGLSKMDLDGKIALIYGELASRPLNLDRNEILLKLEERKPSAVIVISPKFDACNTKIIRDPLFKIPSASVSAQVGLQLMKVEGSKIRVKIEARPFNSITANIFGSLPGRTDKRVCVAAHYDTAPGTQGAVDNASGIAVMLEMARLFSAKSPAKTLDFVAIAGEEYGERTGSFGGNAYVTAHEDRLRKTAVLVNIDSVGAYLNTLRVRANSSDALRRLVTQHMKRIYPDSVLVPEPVPGGDALIFHRKGVPFVMFWADIGPNLWHTPLDNIDTIDPRRLAGTCKLAASTTQDLLETQII